MNQLGSFDSALIYVAAMGLLGAFAYLFIVGPLKRMDLEGAPDAATEPKVDATAPQPASPRG